jgi:uncharacterized membrane protein
MKRINTIDFVRGIVMIIMALDHTRDFIHVSSLTQNPVDPGTSSGFVFFTRWITHFCAPVFVFLSGVSAYLSFNQKQDAVASSKFLRSRGLWLLLLEFTIINFGLWFDIHFNVFLFNVIGTIGISFIILSFLLRFKPATIGMIGLIIVFCHNLVSLLPFADNSILKILLTPFFQQALYPIGANTNLIIGYPPIPWLGIMLTGFWAGKIFAEPIEIRKRYWLRLGITAVLLFIILRWINIYGDPVPWTRQSDPFRTFLSFLNITKYPPSLLFVLITLSGMFFLLWAMDGVENRFTAFVTVYGKVPLFYFLVHWYILHPLLFLILYIQGFTSNDFVFGFNFGRPKAVNGVSIGVVYLIWIAVVLCLYPICKWYGNYKASNRNNKFLRYL